MNIADTINDVKKTLHDHMRKRKFKKANLDRAERSELVSEMSKCNGKLNACKNSFRAAIKEQSAFIAEGRQNGYDTIPQEQILWDAAIGYMLVDDAMFALKSIGSYDSMARAYEMLDAATKQITGKKSKLAKNRMAGQGERDPFGYINSADVVKSKMELLDGFFEILKQTGDIEACLRDAKHPSTVEAERRNHYSDPSSAPVRSQVQTSNSSRTSAFDDILNQTPDSASEIDYTGMAAQAMIDSKPPKTESEEV